MRRRTVLRAAPLAALTGVSGCFGASTTVSLSFSTVRTSADQLQRLYEASDENQFGWVQDAVADHVARTGAARTYDCQVFADGTVAFGLGDPLQVAVRSHDSEDSTRPVLVAEPVTDTATRQTGSEAGMSESTRTDQGRSTARVLESRTTREGERPSGTGTGVPALSRTGCLRSKIQQALARATGESEPASSGPPVLSRWERGWIGDGRITRHDGRRYRLYSREEAVSTTVYVYESEPISDEAARAYIRDHEVEATLETDSLPDPQADIVAQADGGEYSETKPLSEAFERLLDRLTDSYPDTVFVVLDGTVREGRISAISSEM